MNCVALNITDSVFRRRMEAQVWEGHQRDWVYQEETPARVWWQTRGGAAKQEAAGEKGEDILQTQLKNCFCSWELTAQATLPVPASLTTKDAQCQYHICYRPILFIINHFISCYLIFNCTCSFPLFLHQSLANLKTNIHFSSFTFLMFWCLNSLIEFKTIDFSFDL